MASLYLNPTLDSSVAAGSKARIEGDEARHASTVARVRVGERIAIGDGAGTIVWGTVSTVSSTVVEIEVAEVIRDPSPRPAIWLAQALAKGDRDELAIQAATELGVSGVLPWAAERSISRWEGAKIDRGRERWSSIVHEAAKQAVRSWVPVVGALLTTADLAALPGSLLVLDPTAAVALTAVDLPADRITLVVGPEGGIASRELEILDTAGATRVRLGAEILRTSTAGPAALAVLNARLGRW